jgi:hypothetical protein
MSTKTQMQNFSTTFSVDQTPRQVFAAIKNIRGWWSEDIEGKTDVLNEVFSYRYKDIHSCKVKLTEEIQDGKLVYHILDNYFSVFTKDKTEWIDTKLVFEISSDGGKTKVKFTHVGLVPDYECYEVCNVAWTTYINGSLRSLITTGQGQPTPKGEDGINADILRTRQLID